MDSEKERARDNDNRIRYKPVLTFDLIGEIIKNRKANQSESVF